jgi:hypothetical protein
MEILRENLLNLIREKCTSTWEHDVFEDHIIVNVKEQVADFRPVFSSIKKEITRCVRDHFGRSPSSR